MHEIETTLQRELGVSDDYRTDNGLVLMGVDYWCDDCHRQPLCSDIDGTRYICDHCGKPCRLIEAPRLARLICSVLLMKIQ